MMAGLNTTVLDNMVPDSTLTNSTLPNSTLDLKNDVTGPPSLPLYLGAAIVILCGILAANSALTSPDYVWMTNTLMLAGLGILFSYGSRQLGITAQTLDIGFACVLALLLAVFVFGPFSLTQFLPVGADTMQLKILFSLILGGTLWAWTLRTDLRVMLITIPTMSVVAMSATIDVNPPVMICFGVFILTVIFLLIHQNYLQKRSQASTSVSAGVGAAEMPRRLLLAQFLQAGLCWLVVLLVGLIVVVPAQAVFSHLSLAQAIRHLTSGHPGASDTSSGLRFSDDDNLEIGTGDAWSASPEVVMRVTPSDGQPHYWRGRTYDQYTGSGWQSSLENEHADVTEGDPIGDDRLGYAVPSDLTPGDGKGFGGRTEITADFEVRGETSQFYYADSPSVVSFAVDAAQDHPGLRYGADGRLGLTDEGYVHFTYQVSSLSMPDPTQPRAAERLRQAGTRYPAEVRRLYLGQSRTAGAEDLSFYRQTVAQMLQTLPPARRDPLDESLALRDWVARHCTYTLTPPPIPADADHVHYFLGTSRRGYCDMFASSLAVLCRAAGIPARLATGFAPGDPDGSSFNLRAEDKHAWTEVYFPGTGWVTLDATSGSATDGTVPTAQAETRRSWFSRLQLGAGWGLATPLLVIVAAIFGYVLKTEVFDKRRSKRRAVSGSVPSRLSPQSDLFRAYARLSTALARLSLPRLPSETPDEYAARILPLLPALEREGSVTLSAPLVSTLTADFTQALYGDPARPSAASSRWTPLAVSEFAAAARRLYWQRVWRRLTGAGTRVRSRVRSEGA